MTLGELIEALEREPDNDVPLGFGSPHSYRGYYDQLAFEPRRDTTVGKMLASAREALGATYKGYKGGEYKMEEWTDCHLAKYGRTGEQIGPTLLSFMLGHNGVVEDK